MSKLGLTNTKAHFVRHEPCPKCGSRDNLARYSDESAWCFGCRYWEPSVRTLENSQKNNNNANSNPDCDLSFTRSLPRPAIAWLTKYGLTEQEMSNFVWDYERERLTFPVEVDGKIVFWSGRRFGDTGPKYLNWGKPQQVIFGDGRTVILTEDVVSAIKVGRFLAAMPLFGVNVSQMALIELSRRFERIGVWLDANKYPHAAKTVLRGLALGLPMNLHFSKLDPKELSDEAIVEVLTDGRQPDKP